MTNVNKEMNYLIITDYEYDTSATHNLGDDGTIVLRYESVDRNGEYIYYDRELHPEYAWETRTGTYESSKGANQTFFFRENNYANYSDSGYETGQYCKAYTQEYTRTDGTTGTMRRYYVLVDSVTGSVDEYQNGHYFDRFPQFQPGADLHVTAYLRQDGGLEEKASLVTNSLFDHISENADGTYTAHLTNGRHIQNLSSSASSLRLLDSNSTIPDDYAGGKITAASLNADIIWNDVDNYEVTDEGLVNKGRERFYNKGGAEIKSFWDNVDAVISSDDVGKVEDAGGSFDNWNRGDIQNMSMTEMNNDKVFISINLLESDRRDEDGVQAFDFYGNDHRFINMTVRGKVNYEEVRSHCGLRNPQGIGLFTGDSPDYIGGTTSWNTNKNTFHAIHFYKLFLVNPSAGEENFGKQDVAAAAFVGGVRGDKCIISQCGTYMSSRDQYYMGAVDLNSANWTMNDPEHGRHIFSKASSAGGYIGRLRNTLEMTDSFASVPIYGGKRGNTNGAATGGLIGYIPTWGTTDATRSLTIRNCYTSGYLAENEQSGADNSSYMYSPDCVGIVTFSSGGTLGAGGIIGLLQTGQRVTIENCYSTASVASNITASGFIGNISNMSNSMHINNCYTLGSVYAPANNTTTKNALFASIPGNKTMALSVFSDCYAFGLANTEFSVTPPEFAHPVSSIGHVEIQGLPDYEVIEYREDVITPDYLNQDRVNKTHMVRNNTMTFSYNIPRINYPYRPVTKTGYNVENATGATSGNRARYAHYGDWPAVAYDVSIEDVNEENHYLVITDNNYQAQSTDYGSDGLIVLEYSTVDTEGNELTYQRELHPEYAGDKVRKTTDNPNGRSHDSGKVADSFAIGFETSQDVKVTTETYTDKNVEKTRKRYYVLIDSITTLPEFKQNGHAATYGGRFPEMAPGADIHVTAYLRVGGQLVKQGSVTTNSLFDNIEEVGDNAYVAHISNARHLQNLSPRFSNISNKGAAVKIAGFSLDEDIMWEEAYGVDGTAEVFYDATGSQIKPFWTQKTECIPQAARDAVPADTGNFRYSFANWTNSVLSIMNNHNNWTSIAASSIRQTEFVPIQLLDIDPSVTEVANFEVKGNNHRLINFTMGGKAADSNSWRTSPTEKYNWGAIGLFETPGGCAQSFTVHPELTLNIHDLFMVNPNTSVTGMSKGDLGAGAFTGEPYCTLIMDNCGAYMSSVEQYWMGSADMESEYNLNPQSTFDPSKGKQHENGRRILSNGGSVGGLIGRLHGNCEITNCFATVPVYGGMKANQQDASAGGLIGMIRGRYAEKYYDGRYVRISHCYTGGFLENSTTQVESDTATYTYSSESVGVAEFSTNGYSGSGGFIGYLQWGKNIEISDCYSTAAVAGIKNTGGFFGFTYGTGQYVKGINDGGVRVNDCYSLGAVYVSELKEGGMFCAAAKANADTLNQTFNNCFAFGAANSSFTESTDNYVHPDSACGSHLGQSRDDSEIIPFHYGRPQYEGDVVIDIDYLVQDREAHAYSAGKTATMGYSLEMADYPYRAVTAAGKEVIEATGPTAASRGDTVHVGDWPCIRSISNAAVTASNGESLTATISAPAQQLTIATDVSVLIEGKTSGAGAYLKFALTPDEENPLGFTVEMVDPLSSDVASVIPLGTTAEERTAWTDLVNVTPDKENDTIKVTFTIDDPQNHITFADVFDGTGMVPGEDISISIEAGDKKASELEEYIDSPAYIRANKTVNVNSLFDSISTTSNTAQISNARHLLNLDKRISQVNNTDVLRIKTIVQNSNIACPDDFNGIDNIDIIEYDGAGYTLSDLSISDSQTCGLFLALADTHDVSVHDLTLVGEVTATGSTSYAGALVGTIGAEDATPTLTITNVDISQVTVTAPNPSDEKLLGYIGVAIEGCKVIIDNEDIFAEPEETEEENSGENGDQQNANGRNVTFSNNLTPGTSTDLVAGASSALTGEDAGDALSTMSASGNENADNIERNTAIIAQNIAENLTKEPPETPENETTEPEKEES